MTFAQYQEGVRATWNKNIDIQEQVNNAVFGLFGEFGEFAEMLKKSRYHKITFSQEKEKKELGDALYYLTALIDVSGYSLEEIAEMNRDKLKARYPSGFVTGGGIRGVE